MNKIKVVCALWCIFGCACSDDSAKENDQGAAQVEAGADALHSDAPMSPQDSTFPKDQKNLVDGKNTQDISPQTCDPNTLGACGADQDKSKFCDKGVCKSCPQTYFNCDGDSKNQCECQGACQGNACYKP